MSKMSNYVVDCMNDANHPLYTPYARPSLLRRIAGHAAWRVTRALWWLARASYAMADITADFAQRHKY